MIIKPNYLYRLYGTQEFALGGDDVLLVGDNSTIQLEFMYRNNGKIEGKYITVESDEWDNTPKETL